MSVKVVDSSAHSIAVDGLAAGNLYQLHVESLSLSGTATSKSVSFETGPASGRHQQTVWILLAVILCFVALLAVIAGVIRG